MFYITNVYLEDDAQNLQANVVNKIHFDDYSLGLGENCICQSLQHYVICTVIAIYFLKCFILKIHIQRVPKSYMLVIFFFFFLSLFRLTDFLGRRNSNIYMYIYCKNKIWGERRGRVIRDLLHTYNCFHNKFHNYLVGSRPI